MDNAERTVNEARAANLNPWNDEDRNFWMLRLDRLSDQIDERFNAADAKMDNFHDRVKDIENSVSLVKKVSALVMVMLTFFGWDHVRLWMSFLDK